MEWKNVADRLFPQGHDIVQQGDLLAGSGQRPGQVFAVVGTTGHAEVGADLALAMAAAVLDTVARHPGRPILFLIDTQGQRLRHRDEMLGLNRYMSHLGKCVEIARQRGHRVVGLVYDQALSGGFIPNAMMADLCAALPEAEIRVMNLPAMARVTRIAESRLRELSQTSPVFAPGAMNFVSMGAVDALWDGDLGAALDDATARAQAKDPRAAAGLVRGGRKLAEPVIRRVADGA
ncbi:biotin-independent malonate decarboxylase subunit gamma [Orrella dioscoreae]|uniref:Malonate decarboxylase gamma subunit n=1 Tax=Orrella dioscoreae TaxID=1851544 RepID=A0A1C3JWR1_9BURK|nr:biotin-independent malonate decarboxylase subunit gamma [Orrella dioscoreae]SBT23706.1 Malonate decarboxylase gamma subunit [Orrella dioscoreae]SOE47680.1 Malonate decarboxylase gamma subunit [Orrella dioscoreae]